jgi:Predicted transcriptional regulators
MRGYYRIGEISKLYDIGADSLRYYEEIGILRPRRGENGYRRYGVEEIRRLNVVKDLRQFGFSMQRIQAYLDGKNCENTRALLHEEEDFLEAEIRRLRARQRSLRARIAELSEYEDVETGNIAVRDHPARPWVRMEIDSTEDDDVDIALNRLNGRFGQRIYAAANYMIGATIRAEEVRKGAAVRFHSVFYLLHDASIGNDGAIPPGRYLSLHYRGGYAQSGRRIREVLAYADAEGMKTGEEILELYKVDVHETNDEREFLTEIQVRVAHP